MARPKRAADGLSRRTRERAQQRVSTPFLLLHDRLYCPWGPLVAPNDVDLRRLDEAKAAVTGLAGHCTTPLWIMPGGRLRPLEMPPTGWLAAYRRRHAEVRLRITAASTR